jgi:hypothetical protein
MTMPRDSEKRGFSRNLQSPNTHNLPIHHPITISLPYKLQTRSPPHQASTQTEYSPPSKHNHHVSLLFLRGPFCSPPAPKSASSPSYTGCSPCSRHQPPRAPTSRSSLARTIDESGPVVTNGLDSSALGGLPLVSVCHLITGGGTGCTL